MLKLYFTTLIFSIGVYISNAQTTYIQNVFAFIGDYGANDSDEDSVSQLVKSWNPEAIITLGDNNYPNGSASDIDDNIGKYFHDYIKPYSGSYGSGADSNRFWPAVGNHDLMTASGAAYFNYFQLPSNERYYDFVNGDIHFFCLNSNLSETDGCTDTSIQANWLINQLQNSTAKWNIVYTHHSPYSSDSLYGNHEYMQWPYKTWGADIVLTAHTHTYERFVIDSFPYIISGLGGRGRYDFDAIPEPGSIVRYNEKYGALQLKVRPDTLWFKFFTVDNELIDSLFLAKPSSLDIDNRDESESSHPKFFPNPSSGNLSINFENCKIQNSEITVTIRDMVGNKLYSETFQSSQNNALKISALPEKMSTGLYLVQVSSDKQQFNDKVLLIR